MHLDKQASLAAVERSSQMKKSLFECYLFSLLSSQAVMHLSKELCYPGYFQVAYSLSVFIGLIIIPKRPVFCLLLQQAKSQCCTSCFYNLQISVELVNNSCCLYHSQLFSTDKINDAVTIKEMTQFQ